MKSQEWHFENWRRTVANGANLRSSSPEMAMHAHMEDSSLLDMEAIEREMYEETVEYEDWTESENFMEGALVGVRRRRERRARIDSDPCDRSTEHLVIRHYVVESGVVSGDRPLANQLSIGVLALSACEKTVPTCIGRP